MDTALNINGDFEKDENGMAYRIFGKDEIKQKAYILLSARLGAFIYNRELGSEIYKIDINQDDAVQKITAQARKTLADIPQIEVIGAEIVNGQVIVSININDENYAVTLRK